MKTLGHAGPLSAPPYFAAMTTLPPHISLFYEFLTGVRERRASHRGEIHRSRGTLQSRPYRKPDPNIIWLRHSSPPASRHRYSKFFPALSGSLGATDSSGLWGTLPGALVVAGPAIATARNRLRVVGCARERYLACPRQPFLRRAVHRRNGGVAIQARSVHTVGNPIIYGLSPLFTAYRRGSSCSSRRRLPRHRCAFHSAPFAFFARMMVLQFIAALFSMPEARAMALERMNEHLCMSGRKSSRRNM
jgi:hypothetical protein